MTLVACRDQSRYGTFAVGTCPCCRTCNQNLPTQPPRGERAWEAMAGLLARVEGHLSAHACCCCSADTWLLACGGLWLTACQSSCFFCITVNFGRSPSAQPIAVPSSATSARPQPGCIHARNQPSLFAFPRLPQTAGRPIVIPHHPCGGSAPAVSHPRPKTCSCPSNPSIFLVDFYLKTSFCNFTFVFAQTVAHTCISARKGAPHPPRLRLGPLGFFFRALVETAIANRS